MTNHKLRASQIGAILFFLTRCSFTLFGYHFLFQKMGNEALLTFLIASGISIFFFSILLKQRKKKKLSISKFTRIIGLFFLLYLFFFYLNEATSLIQKEFINTSWFFIYICLIFTSYLLTKQNLFSLGSNSLLLLFPFLFFFIALFLGGIPLVNLDYLKPFFLTPPDHILESIFFSVLFLLPAHIFLLFLPRNTIVHEDHQEKTFFFYYILGCLSIFLEIFLMHLTLGSNLTTIYPYPLFALTSRISSFLIFDRIFFLFSFYLLFDSTIFLSVLFLGIKSIKK